MHTCKAKSTRNPLYRWVIGEGCINEFAFSPCSRYLAVSSQDGYLRVFDYNSMELLGAMKSYFGGLLCVCWSPDGKYIVTGGEDDLVTVWSFPDRTVVCRGAGHKSWVNVVSFDPYTSCVPEDGCDFNGSDDDFTRTSHKMRQNSKSDSVTMDNSDGGSKRNSTDVQALNITSYRFGSVGQDTMLCIWDLTEDVLHQPVGRTRTSTVLNANAMSHLPRSNSLPHSQKSNSLSNESPSLDGTPPQMPNAVMNTTTKFATLSLGDRKDRDHHEKKDHKRNFSLASRSDKSSILKSNHVRPVSDSLRVLGSLVCPRLDDAPMLEPLICKRVAHERLTSLVFRDDCIVTACQEGFVYTWARPGKMVGYNDV